MTTAPDRRYRMGQVIYLFLPATNFLGPFRVTQENVTRTIDSSGQARESVSYRVAYGSKSETHDLSKVLEKGGGGHVFLSPKEAHDALMAQAKSYVDRVVSTATSQAREWYPGSPPFQAQQPAPFDASSAAPEEESSNDTLLELPDGTVARLGKVSVAGS